MDKKLVTVDVRDLYDELDRYAKLMETSKASIIRLAVREFFKNKKPE